MKRFIALILAVCIISMLFVLPTGAEGEVFVAAGNTVLPLTSAMPIPSGGIWYIDYQCFTKGNLNVSTSYNAAEGTLVLYTWDTTLIFDLNKATAYTATEKVPYKAVAFRSSGTVYIPVQFTAQILGFEYTYFPDLPMIRIKRSSDIPNNMFEYIAKNEMPKLLSEYNAKKKEESAAKPPIQNTPQDNPDESTEQKNIRLTFNITSGNNMNAILDALSRYNFRATFFIQGSAISSCENEIRRAVAGGHSLGTLSENGNADFEKTPDKLTSALSRTNERLFEVAKTKTRLVRVPIGSKTLSSDKVEGLIASGYRIWDDTITPTGNTAGRLYNSVVSGLSAKEKTTVTLTLTDSDVSVSALARILKYLDTNNYRAYTITLLDTPVNDISEKR